MSRYYANYPQYLGARIILFLNILAGAGGVSAGSDFISYLKMSKPPALLATSLRILAHIPLALKLLITIANIAVLR